MEGALGWLGDLIRAVGRLVPRLAVMRATHGGVAFVRGKNVKQLKPGLYWWWPVWTECITYPTVRQSLNLPSQSLTTNDDITVTVSGVVIYQVQDITVALSSQWDLNETIRDLSMAAIREFVCSNGFKATNRDRSRMDHLLTSKLQDALRPYGIDVLQASLTDFAKAKVISMAGSGIGAYIDEEEDE